ncbi:MAG: cobalamin B12-binding domain protein, partial [Deltaproteobacteria bacterium]|nr:cobalamin B12-binding domain protein [Deltaproteobacteria bacterium]
GCWMMNLGIETGDSGLLAAHRRHADLDRTGRAIRTIKEAGIRTKGLLMMGLPGETEESVRKSMDYVFSHPIDDFNLTKFTPFPGSPIYEKIRSLGDFDEDWEKMDCMHFLFVTKGMTRERLEALYREFHVAHYRRPKVLLGYVAMLWRSPDSWVRFARNLGTFLKFACFARRLTDEGSGCGSRRGPGG